MRKRLVTLFLTLLALAIGCSPAGTPIVESTPPSTRTISAETPSPTAQPTVVPTQTPVFPRQRIAYVVANRLHIFDPTTGVAVEFPHAIVVNTIHKHEWSVDGHSIFFVGSTMNNVTGYPDDFISQLNIDTGEITTIIKVNLMSLFSLSPDGRMFVFMYNGLQTELGIMNVDGTSMQILTSTPGCESYPAWSPDGSKIAYLYGERQGYTCLFDQSELRILNLADNSTTTLIQSDINIGPFDWSPDGEGITFAYDMDECTNIFEIKLADQSIMQLTDLQTCTYSPDWSLDGKWLVFQVSNLKTGIWWAKEWNVYGLFDGATYPLITGIDASSPYPKISPVPYLNAGRTCSVTRLGDERQIFSSASLASDVLGTLAEGDPLLVLSGPVDTEGYYWWLVQTQENTQGWVRDVAGWYSCEDD